MDKAEHGSAFFLKPPLFVLFLVSLALVGYFPGLGGPFFFDDYGTLPHLARFGGIDSVQTAILFFADDITGTSGRPLSLLSFLLNSTTWPADPWGFKATNLALHLITGALLFVCCRQMLAYLGVVHGRLSLAAALTAGFWLLNPFNVSTVLYVVQRMAMLSALFMLGGLVVYLHGRRIWDRRPRRGYAWMTAAVVLFTPLAALSKENGALLPLLLLVLEYTVFQNGPVRMRAVEGFASTASPSRWWFISFLWLPGLALVGLLIYFGRPETFVGRDFNVGERLLTEARVLFEYLWYWFNPFAMPRGVLADGYAVSRSLVSPWSTLPAAVGILGLLTWALWQRRRYPLASLAVLFYLVGHLMESTILPLELYFEHRNYLPAMLLALPLAAWVARSVAHSGEGHLRQGRQAHLLAVILTGVALLAFTAQTYRLAKIWGDELALAKWSLAANPSSTRAYDNLAGVLAGKGRPDLAVGILEAGIRQHPDNSHFHLHLLAQKCAARQVAESDWVRLEVQAAHHPLDVRDMPLLTNLVARAPGGGCGQDEMGHLVRLARLLAELPAIQHDGYLLGLLRHLEGELQVKSGQVDGALAAFGASMSLRGDMGQGLQQVALLATHGYFREGLGWLEHVARLPPPRGWKGRIKHDYYTSEIARLRANLLADLAGQEAEASARQ